MVRNRGSARSSRIRPKPSRPGIITSDTTSAGGCARRGERRDAVRHRFDLVVLGEQPPRVFPQVGVVVGEQDALSAPSRFEHALRPREPAQRFVDVGAGAHRGRGAARGPDAIGWKVRRAARNAHHERGALAELALHCDRAAVELDQLLHQREADAAAFVAAAAHPLDAVEPLERARQLLRGNACARILHS
jgi:hypothetical protein